jgi:hypothetical protein
MSLSADELEQVKVFDGQVELKNDNYMPIHAALKKINIEEVSSFINKEIGKISNTTSLKNLDDENMRKVWQKLNIQGVPPTREGQTKALQMIKKGHLLKQIQEKLLPLRNTLEDTVTRLKIEYVKALTTSTTDKPEPKPKPTEQNDGDVKKALEEMAGLLTELQSEAATGSGTGEAATAGTPEAKPGVSIEKSKEGVEEAALLVENATANKLIQAFKDRPAGTRKVGHRPLLNEEDPEKLTDMLKSQINFEGFTQEIKDEIITHAKEILIKKKDT